MEVTTNNQNCLNLIFELAEREMKNFKMPLTNEGKFEVLMYGIWLGMKVLDESGLPQNNAVESSSKISDFLVEYAKKLDISPDKKVERLFVLRDGDWYRETNSFVESNYPQTKQYLPDYHYLCFVVSPLVFYEPMALCEKVKQIDTSDLIDFLPVFGDFYNKLIDDFKVFESDSNSYKSLAEQIIVQDSSEKDDQQYKPIYRDFEKDIIERMKAKEDGQLSAEELFFMPSDTLVLLDKLAVETIRSFKILNLGKGADVLGELLKKDLDYLQKNRNGVVEYATPMLEKNIETRKRCAVLLRSMEKEKYIESKEDLESVISKGEEMLNQFRKSIDSSIKFIDYVIDLKSGKAFEDSKSGKYGTGSNKNESKKGCLSVFVLVFIIATAITCFLI